MRQLCIALPAFASLALSANASFAAPAVIDSSYRATDGRRVQQCSTVVDASVAQVWKAFTTDAGLTRWAVPVTHIDFRNGGIMESSYSLDGKIGVSDNIKNEIVAYLPERLLAMRNVHVPKGAPFNPALIATIRTIFAFEDLGNGKTRVTESGVGYGEGAGYDSLYQTFRDGNAAEMVSLARSFASGPVDWKAQAAKLNAAAGAH